MRYTMFRPTTTTVKTATTEEGKEIAMQEKLEEELNKVNHDVKVFQ